VSILSERESTSDPVEIKESLDDLVQKLDRGKTTSSDWSESLDGNKEDWEQLKNRIQQCQRALKQLVVDKKAGLIGSVEFEEKYPKLQDELAELETKVYNMRLGTDIK
jgi:chromosome segregation ATPase